MLNAAKHAFSYFSRNLFIESSHEFRIFYFSYLVNMMNAAKHAFSYYSNLWAVHWIQQRISNFVLQSFNQSQWFGEHVECGKTRFSYFSIRCSLDPTTNSEFHFTNISPTNTSFVCWFICCCFLSNQSDWLKNSFKFVNKGNSEFDVGSGEQPKFQNL